MSTDKKCRCLEWLRHQFFDDLFHMHTARTLDQRDVTLVDAFLHEPTRFFVARKMKYAIFGYASIPRRFFCGGHPFTDEHEHVSALGGD